jgi:hypothetical protein
MAVRLFRERFGVPQGVPGGLREIDGAENRAESRNRPGAPAGRCRRRPRAAGRAAPGFPLRRLRPRQWRQQAVDGLHLDPVAAFRRSCHHFVEASHRMGHTVSLHSRHLAFVMPGSIRRACVATAHFAPVHGDIAQPVGNPAIARRPRTEPMAPPPVRHESGSNAGTRLAPQMIESHNGPQTSVSLESGDLRWIDR